MSDRPSAERLAEIRESRRFTYMRPELDELLRELDAVTRERDELDASLRYAKATIDVVTQQRDEARDERDACARAYGVLRESAYRKLGVDAARAVTDDMVFRFAASYGPRWFGSDWPLPFEPAQEFCAAVRGALEAAL